MNSKFMFIAGKTCERLQSFNPFRGLNSKNTFLQHCKDALCCLKDITLLHITSFNNIPSHNLIKINAHKMSAFYYIRRWRYVKLYICSFIFVKNKVKNVFLDTYDLQNRQCYRL